ncbi:hypothetical protein [Desulfogranum japonicum]|uniref:hypothetical protein n=1 Tax=Desulfogranum japonicum TaxID=231447 RepID=UPI000429D22A|nr:hypothetical protein [Desulfogranum japonicum]
MKIAQPVQFGAWLLIVMNLFMAFASIWIFMRMAPAIEVIIARNAASLESCENMLTALLQANITIDDGSRPIERFRNALQNAEDNITEKKEPVVIRSIITYYPAAFTGDTLALAQTLSAIEALAEVNRKAMHRADIGAQQLGKAGAWAIVFMGTTSFIIGMIFLRSLQKNLSEPIEEIDAVITAFRQGASMRRCTMENPPQNIRKVFNNINELLDANISYKEYSAGNERVF